MRRSRNIQAGRVLRWQPLVATLLAGLAMVCTILLYSQVQPAGSPATSATDTQLMAVEPAQAPKPRPGQLIRWVEPESLPLTRRSDQIKANTPSSQVTFNGRPLRRARKMTMLVTAYSPDARSCGTQADGITASGYSVWTNGMKLAAADTRLLPFGTLISIPGYHHGQPIPILDRGGKIKGHRIDVLYPTHEIARRFGVQKLTVTVWEYAD